MTVMKASGPAVSGLPIADRNIQMAVEAHGLQRMVPRFFEAGSTDIYAALQPKDEVVLKVSEFDFTLPEVVQVWFNAYTGAEPAVSYSDFVKGVASAANMLDPSSVEIVKQMLEVMSGEISAGSDLPMLSSDFADPVWRCVQTIFNNNEPMSFRPLLAFCSGAFWLLAFVDDPRKKRGKASPLDFVYTLVNHFGQLGYLP